MTGPYRPTPLEKAVTALLDMRTGDWRALTQTIRRMFKAQFLDMRKIHPAIREYLRDEPTPERWDTLRKAVTQRRASDTAKAKYAERQKKLERRRLQRRAYMHEYRRRKRLATTKGDTI